MRANRLRLNPTKSPPVTWLGSSQQVVAKLDVTHLRVLFQDTARDLGVVIDSQLLLSAHVAEDASETSVQAFVSCRLDCCNSVLRHPGRTVAVGSERRRPLLVVLSPMM